MGLFENIQYFLITLTIGSLISSLLSFYIFRYFIVRVNNLKNERKSFYECGFKPNIQKPISISINFFLVSILFILFDTDLLFLYPLLSGFSYYCYLDVLFLAFVLTCLFISILYEKKNNSFL